MILHSFPTRRSSDLKSLCDNLDSHRLHFFLQKRGSSCASTRVRNVKACGNRFSGFTTHTLKGGARRRRPGTCLLPVQMQEQVYRGKNAVPYAKQGAECGV